MPDRMSPLDASFLHIEDGVTHMHIGSVSIMQGPPPPYQALQQMILGKLPMVPRYRQVVMPVPLELGRPVWVDDQYFNIQYHLRRTALPRPGGETELRRLVGRIMAQQLDRSKPLWEMWMVEGLDDDKWALISKVHHCMVDGVSGSDLLSLVLDLSPDAPIYEASEWDPGPPPAAWELAAEAVMGLASSPFEMMRAVRARTRVPRRALHQVAEVVQGIGATIGSVRPLPRTSLNGPIGPHRRWVGTAVSVAEIKAVRHALGGTFNDVVLACISGGFRDLMSSRGEPVEQPIRTLVPVSIRPRDASGRAIGDGTLANKVSGMFAMLPINLADPVDRLHAISEQMAGLKESKQAMGAESLTSLSGFAPPVLLALGGRLATKIGQRSVNTVTTNVPGPQVPLYAAGRKMVEIFPYVPVGGQMRIGVAIFSYDGVVSFGVTGDYDSAPDIDVLADGIKAGMAELLSAARLGPDGRPQEEETVTIPDGNGTDADRRPVTTGRNGARR